MDKDLPISEQRPIAEEILGQGSLVWEENRGRRAAPGSVYAYVTCPGIESHTGKDAARDCRIYLDPAGPASVYCAHTSCQAEREAVTYAIRSAIGKAKRAKRAGDGRSKLGDGKQRKMKSLPPLQVRVPAPRKEIIFASEKSDGLDGAPVRTSRTIDLDAFGEWEGAAQSAAKGRGPRGEGRGTRVDGRGPEKAEGRRQKDESIQPTPEPVAVKPVETKLVTAIYPRTGEIHRALLKGDRVEHTAYLGQEWKPDTFYDETTT